MLMNALAMKYLPCDLNKTQSPKAMQNAVTQTTPTNIHMKSALAASAAVAARYSHSAPTTPTTPNDQLLGNQLHDQFGGKNITHDMSISSYRYMQKYGLL